MTRITEFSTTNTVIDAEARMQAEDHDFDAGMIDKDKGIADYEWKLEIEAQDSSNNSHYSSNNQVGMTEGPDGEIEG